MVLLQDVQKPIQQVLALLRRHAVDVLHVAANREDTLPTRHRVRSHNRVNSFENTANVLWVTARLVV